MNKNIDLLIKDLSARVHYGVNVLIPECRKDIATLIGVDDTCFAVKYGESKFYCPFNISIKPYLRSMSNMTEEEKEEFNHLYYDVPVVRDNGNSYRDIKILEWMHIDWYNVHHFDYRGLIERGLAIEAPEGMYNLK